LKASMRPPAAADAVGRSAANVRWAANPIGGNRVRQGCGSRASRLVPVTELEDAACGGRRARWSYTKMD